MVQVGEKIQVSIYKCEKNVRERYMWSVVASQEGSNRLYL